MGCLYPMRANRGRVRLTLIRVFEELPGLGYEGSYDAVRRFSPGEADQFDWSHEVVLIDGVTSIMRGVRIQRAREMLERAVYAGYVSAPNWGVGLVRGKHEPLISFETHQRVLDRLKGRCPAAFRKDTRDDFPLCGILTCACCGRAMTAAFSKGRHSLYGYYFCQTQGCEQAGQYDLVPRKGLEPPRLAALAPEASASTNSAIWAFGNELRPRRNNVNCGGAFC